MQDVFSDPQVPLFRVCTRANCRLVLWLSGERGVLIYTDQTCAMASPPGARSRYGSDGAPWRTRRHPVGGERVHSARSRVTLAKPKIYRNTVDTSVSRFALAMTLITHSHAHLHCTTAQLSPMPARRLVGPAVKFGRTPAAITRAPPLLGEHTDEVMHPLGQI